MLIKFPEVFPYLIPTMPTFVRLSKPIFTNKNGYAGMNSTVAVKDMSEEEANQYAELWKEEFIKHWKTLQTQP